MTEQHQLPLPLPSNEETIIKMLRDTVQLLGELSAHYKVGTKPTPLPDRPNFPSPKDIHNLLAPDMSNLVQEQLRTLLLDYRNNLVAQRMIYQGNVNSSIIRVAEVLRPAVIEACPHIIVVHNHPSGDPTPSPEDVKVTNTIKEAAALLDIELLDHIVIGAHDFVSMKEQNLF